VLNISTGLALSTIKGILTKACLSLIIGIMDPIEQLKHFIEKSRQIVVFTGAGISTESGISDYRSQGGIWQRFQPVTIQEFMADEDKRKLYWQRKLALFEENKGAQPNLGHKAIVELERQGKLRALITQNIDGLHQMAGTSSDKILELHGTNLEVICLTCGDIHAWNYAYQRLIKGEEVPLCEKCNGFLKPNTISFGQTLDPVVLEQCFMHANECDFMLVLGSSLVVEPAASIPRTAKQHDAWLAIITQSETPLDHMADLKMENTIGEILNKAILQ